MAVDATPETFPSLVGAGLGFSLVPWLDPRGPRAPAVRTYRLRSRKSRLPLWVLWRDSGVLSPPIAAALSVAPES